MVTTLQAAVLAALVVQVFVAPAVRQKSVEGHISALDLPVPQVAPFAGTAVHLLLEVWQ